MLEFFQNYWTHIVTGLLVILDFILIFIKKRPQIIDSSFISKVIVWIKQAESFYKHGEDKLKYVLSMAHNDLKANFNEKEVTDIVEMILALPSKKKEN